jgi:hypothetical protein
MSIAHLIGDYSNPRSLGSRFRRRRSVHLRALIEQVHADKGKVSILDVGGWEAYWDIIPLEFLTRHNVSVVLLNKEFYINTIARPDIFKALEGDGCALPYSHNSFDICHSNSVIEHVGTWSHKQAFASEVRRVAPRYFVQTPNYWFPWEPHFGLPIYHWLPDPLKLWITMHWKLGWTPRAENVSGGMATLEFATLLNRKMMSYLFPDARLNHERILGVTKSFIAVR